MNISPKHALALCIFGSSLLVFSAPAAAGFFDDFEDGDVSGWLDATTGGIRYFGVQLHNSSQMAYVSHTGWGNPYESTTTSSSLSQDFAYSAAETLSFDMHAIATAGSDHGVTRHSGSGIKIQFLNAFNIPIGSAGLYNYTNPALLGAHEYLTDGVQHHYEATMAEFAKLAGLDDLAPIAKISLTLTAWGQFAGGGRIYPDVAGSATVWFDNVAVGTNEEAAFALQRSLVAGCKGVTGTVILPEPAPPEGLVVALSDTLVSASTPGKLKFLSGERTKSFTVATVPVAAKETGTVSATIGAKTLSQTLTVRPMGLYSVSLSPTTAVGGNTVAGKVTLECKAPAPAGMMVDLASSNAAVAAPVAANIAVPAGYQSWPFDVTTNGVLGKTTASISGTANGITKSKTLTVTPAASVSPASLKFGYVVVNTTSPVLSATLSNKGTLPFSIISIGLTGTSAKYYAQTSECPANLAAGATCTIGVTFTPTVTGSKSAKLSIATSATAVPLSVSLSGTGVLPP